MPTERVLALRDRFNDLWFEGGDGLMWSKETAPFSREHVEKKWGPLTEQESTAAERDEAMA